MLKTLNQYQIRIDREWVEKGEEKKKEVNLCYSLQLLSHVVLYTL